MPTNSSFQPKSPHAPNHHIMTDQQPPLTINKAAKLLGISPSVLRIWEMRYNWPKPLRHKGNSYRLYDAAAIDDLQWVVERIATGAVISELINDGKVTRDRSREVVADRTWKSLDFSGIPQPETEEGRRIRVQLEAAIRNGNAGERALAQSMAARLRPSEREKAVGAVLEMAAKAGC